MLIVSFESIRPSKPIFKTMNQAAIFAGKKEHGTQTEFGIRDAWGAARQRESGMTISNYAKQIGTTSYKLQYWISKFKAKEVRKNKNANLEFIDLGSFGAAPILAIGKEAAQEQWRDPQIKLTFLNGMCLKIY